MICTSYLSEACHQLFVRYPLAAGTANRSGTTVRTMVLMLRDSDGVRFFVLSNDHSEGMARYSVRRRRTTDIIDIGPNGGVIPDRIVNAVAHGVPLPRDGSLFAWIFKDAVTALVPVYTTRILASPEPFWAVMPRTDTSEAQWPEFIEERLFGHWFWEFQQAGKLVSVADLIAGTPGTVFWAKTKPILGSNCCAVARDLKSAEGYTLRHGRYVHYQALRAGKQVPSLKILLADNDKVDLATRFRQSANSDGQNIE